MYSSKWAGVYMSWCGVYTSCNIHFEVTSKALAAQATWADRSIGIRMYLTDSEMHASNEPAHDMNI